MFVRRYNILIFVSSTLRFKNSELFSKKITQFSKNDNRYFAFKNLSVALI